MLEQPAAGAKVSASTVTSNPSVAREMTQLQEASDLLRHSRGQHHARVAERQAQVIPEARHARFVYADRAVVGRGAWCACGRLGCGAALPPTGSRWPRR